MMYELNFNYIKTKNLISLSLFLQNQNIFRIYRLGQTQTCYVYRFVAASTMEERVYSRSVTKEAMSHRVVEKKQIERHYV